MEKLDLYKDELVGRAYHHLRVSSIAVVINATVLLAVLYENVNSKHLILWYVLVFLVSVLRNFSSKLYKKNKNKFSVKKWEQIFYLGLFVSTALLGVFPLLFFVPDDYQLQAMVIVVIAGLSAGGISSLSSLLYAAWLFIVFLLSPLIVQLFLQDTQIHNTMAFLISLYLILLMYTVRQFNKQYFDILDSRKMYEDEKEKLLRSEERFEKVFKQAPLGIMIYDKNLIIREVNQEFVDFLEAPHYYLIGLDLNTLPDQSVLPSIKAALDDIEGFYEGEYRTKYKQKDLWISMSTSPLKDSSNNVIGGIGIISNITQRMLTQLEFEYQASHDHLTDIPNRTTLLERIEYEIIRFKRHGIICGIMFLDLDHFKNINDSLGHAAGDEILIQTAKRFKNIIRAEDTVARIGGDEFVILLPDLANNENQSATNAEYIAQKVHNALREPFEIKGYKLNISSSIGITLINEKDKNADDLLKHADIAMYQAKKAGRNTTRFYKDKMDEWVKRRLGIENGLRNAISNGELEIHYQPIIEISSSNFVGAEALLRWSSKEFGNVSPEEFIPIAEESGLILSIGSWVLQNSVQQFAEWQKMFPHIKTFKKIAVNISVHQFEDTGFFRQVDTIIQESGIQADNLELELVESIIVKDMEKVRDKMQMLRDLGVRISIDDFGTGYSSLSYLKKLPFSTLKIDKSFIHDIQYDIDDKELISTILTIAKNFNLEVVAEGVETYEQYLFLNEKMCDYIQGYYCSKPIDTKSFTELFVSTNGVCQVVLNQ